MRLVGRLRDWNDARGFGFVTPNGGGERAFVHIGAFESCARRPIDGDLLSYAPTVDARGRRNAACVRFATAASLTPRPSRARTTKPFRATRLAAVFALALMVLVAVGRLPWAVPAAYLVMSTITYFAYLADKSAAVRGRRRTPESTLHAMALLGGWPGAAFAQQHFEHKRSKPVFVRTFRVTVALNVVVPIAVMALRAQWLP